MDIYNLKSSDIWIMIILSFLLGIAMNVYYRVGSWDPIFDWLKVAFISGIVVILVCGVLFLLDWWDHVFSRSNS